MPNNHPLDSAFGRLYPAYMEPSVAAELLEQSKERHRQFKAKQLHMAAVRDSMARLLMAERRHGERRSGEAPRFGTMQDALDFHERRVRDRRFDTAPMALPFHPL